MYFIWLIQNNFVSLHRESDKWDSDMIKEVIIKEIGMMFREWDNSEISELTELIGEFVADDVMCSSSYPNYNSSDVRMAIKRVLINNLRDGVNMNLR